MKQVDLEGLSLRQFRLIVRLIYELTGQRKSHKLWRDSWYTLNRGRFRAEKRCSEDVEGLREPVSDSEYDSTIKEGKDSQQPSSLSFPSCATIILGGYARALYDWNSCGAS